MKNYMVLEYMYGTNRDFVMKIVLSNITERDLLSYKTLSNTFDSWSFYSVFRGTYYGNIIKLNDAKVMVYEINTP